ncbi:MAG TPA: DUF423 domain-containing protein [Cytophagales bacterium]|jgi:uncharacterized membrane protein YgdD (TMEM256/DUF423 family)|nr:DUF423 domain-containing protein [Cytophagales bacterium]
MNQKLTFITGALFGMLSVGLGAFGAHALKNLLTQHGRTETYELAVKYQFYHGITLLVLGLLMEKFHNNLMAWSSLSMTLGILFFSGSLYLFALTNQKMFAMITPIGGLFLLAGWAIMLLAIVKN